MGEVEAPGLKPVVAGGRFQSGPVVGVVEAHDLKPCGGEEAEITFGNLKTWTTPKGELRRAVSCAARRCIEVGGRGFQSAVVGVVGAD